MTQGECLHDPGGIDAPASVPHINQQRVKIVSLDGKR